MILNKINFVYIIYMTELGCFVSKELENYSDIGSAEVEFKLTKEEEEVFIRELVKKLITNPTYLDNLLKTFKKEKIYQYSELKKIFERDGEPYTEEILTLLKSEPSEELINKLLDPNLWEEKKPVPPNQRGRSRRGGFRKTYKKRKINKARKRSNGSRKK